MKPDLLPGSRIRDSHQWTVQSILGEKKKVPVTSRGDRFYTTGRFSWRAVGKKLSEISAPPTRRQVSGWKAPDVASSIVIAAVPDSVPRRWALAAMGGAAHEAFHNRYTCSEDLSADKILHVIAPRWSLAPWAQYGELLLNVENIFEDIGIERIGRVEFPGTEVKLYDLQDFILAMERPSLEALRTEKTSSTARIALSTLRDVGLGYHTDIGAEALALYREINPRAVDLVLDGPLTPLLVRAQLETSSTALVKLSRGQLWDGSSLELAMETVGVLHHLREERKLPPPPSKKSSGGGGGTPSQLPSTREEAGASLVDDYAAHGSGEMLDGEKALTQGVAEVRAQQERTLTLDEAPYLPYSTADDRVVRVSIPKSLPSEWKATIASTRRATAYFRSRLVQLFRALEPGDREHGVRRGRELSGRTLAETALEIRAKEEPRRAWIENSEELDLSVATATVIDESGSMKGEKSLAAVQVTYALEMAFEAIGAVTMVVGFRNRNRSGRENLLGLLDAAAGTRYHRVLPVYYDVFKTWSERWTRVAPRLLRLDATGSTPMADGVEFASASLRARREGHRFLFVVTDGEPDPAHGPVLRGQLRRLKEEGIGAVFVGLGEGAKYVTQFPDHVWSADLASLQVELVKKIETLVRTLGSVRHPRNAF
jgi:hypothetical protein